MDTRALPVENGFRLRGGQVTRTEAFVDAAFAFTLTLLVISVDRVPSTIQELLDALKGVPAFAACFAQLGLFWHGHSRWSRRYGLDDGRSTLLSLLLVFLVMVYVYPLKLLFGTFFAWITGGWIPSPLERLSGYDDIRIMFIVYGLAFATLSLCLAALYSHALRQRAVLDLDLEETAQTAAEVAVLRWAALVGALSLLTALAMPAVPPYWLAGLPGLVYFLMNLSYWVGKRAAGRARRRYGAGSS
ncbi:TMEM175 family protein [Arenimonas fontis]|uniref:DUF1211 domain-containing protein n=1 Tax=Arenimonas fontis TaxID=2608255 RepID=A0A5B2ZAY8_9GAMM|nr:TMEM175 family protein [Arenimonas fontis]KAA2284311.1 DUF1211 domain-containing protein [Arenimonas fontis]